MRYMNRKTGCIASVRDGKPMDTDWEPIRDSTKSHEEADGIEDMTVSQLEAYAAEVGADVTKAKLKADKIEAIKRHMEETAQAVEADDPDEDPSSDPEGTDAEGE